MSKSKLRKRIKRKKKKNSIVRLYPDALPPASTGTNANSPVILPTTTPSIGLFFSRKVTVDVSIPLAKPVSVQSRDIVSVSKKTTPPIVVNDKRLKVLLMFIVDKGVLDTCRLVLKVHTVVVVAVDDDDDDSTIRLVLNDISSVVLHILEPNIFLRPSSVLISSFLIVKHRHLLTKDP